MYSASRKIIFNLLISSETEDPQHQVKPPQPGFRQRLTPTLPGQLKRLPHQPTPDASVTDFPFVINSGVLRPVLKEVPFPSEYTLRKQ